MPRCFNSWSMPGGSSKGSSRTKARMTRTSAWGRP
eukprot:CAMPEP_0198302508 /NCGR_PEP_ID=MMETSP1449-20131203/55461_1 /TAXON_ID=420275 /ORGANISM="Attheya septentrionalis, Strain CCMP2084" /LENGTH=34 /DNA_ID= /DNA_START= /DNA_END= /DNA_ORIENTATION=